MSDRREPVLGTIPEPGGGSATSPRTSRPVRMPERRAWPWWVGAGLMVVLVAAIALHHWRDALGKRLVPPPQQTHTMQLADAALHAGKLTATDGSGARELYQAVLARDPDHLAAREGLVRVGATALTQAQTAIKANHPEQAQQLLVLARELSVPLADLQPVEESLEKGKGGEAQIETLLAQAGQSMREGHLDDGDGSAVERYQQALAASPGNPVVLAKRQVLLAQMLVNADAMIAQGDIADAQKQVDRVASIDPGNLDLPAARARLGEASERIQQKHAQDLATADAAARSGRFDAAVGGYRKVIASDPENQRAQGGLRAVAEALVGDSRRASAHFDFARAESDLAKARELVPDLATTHAAEQYLRLVRARHSGHRLNVNSSAKIEVLLAAADRAIERNQLLEPPGDSAFDKLRAAAAIAPGDPRVSAATHRIVATSVACYQRELTSNRISNAQACFDALIAIQPTFPKLASMRQALAARWLAYADERIGAGEFGNAQRAIVSAKQLTPNDPAIAPLEKRLREAQAGGHR